MRIKKSSLCFMGFLFFASLSFCLNFFFFAKSDSTELRPDFTNEEISTNNESILEAQLVEELSQLPPYELKQVMMNQF